MKTKSQTQRIYLQTIYVIKDKYLEDTKNSQDETVRNKNKTKQNEGKIWTDISAKEDIQMASKYLEKCSTSLVKMEIQTKTTVRYHYPRIGIMKAKKAMKPSAGEDVTQLKLS